MKYTLFQISRRKLFKAILGKKKLKVNRLSFLFGCDDNRERIYILIVG